jgi:hypothetical protein
LKKLETLNLDSTKAKVEEALKQTISEKETTNNLTLTKCFGLYNRAFRNFETVQHKGAFKPI